MCPEPVQSSQGKTYAVITVPSKPDHAGDSKKHTLPIIFRINSFEKHLNDFILFDFFTQLEPLPI